MRPTNLDFRITLFLAMIALIAQGMLAGVVVPASPVHAQSQAQAQTGTPIDQMLNTDGTLDLATGFSGSLDPKGYTMQTGPSGEPRFVPVAGNQDGNGKQGDASGYPQGAADKQNGPSPDLPGDEYWDPRFGYSGMNSYVYAMAVSGTDVYVGGSFSHAGPVASPGIARWSGGQWFSLSSSMNGTVYAIAVIGSNVYAGGSFTTISGVSTGHIAKYNGSTWSSIGGAIGTVYALTSAGNSLYIGGDFTTAGGMLARHIARYNAVSGQWSALPNSDGSDNGVDGPVYAIAVNSATGRVYVGGDFDYAAGVPDPVKNIALWSSGAMDPWSAVSDGGVGSSGRVYALLFDGYDLYAAGHFSFYISGEGTINNMGKYDTVNHKWINLSIPDGVNATYVRAIAMAGGHVYAAGQFNNGYGIAEGTNITYWDGYGWQYLGSSQQNEGVNDTVWALAGVASVLYTGGEFTQAQSTSTQYIALWDPGSQTWSALNSGMNGIVHAEASSGSNVYVGGDFTQAGGVSANYIARWDGTRWNPVGSGLNGIVRAIAVSGSNLYVGGEFTIAGSVSAARIARWNGTTWSTMGSGMNDTVRAIVVDGTNIYAGGDFTTAGGVTANHVARWNGTSWSALSSGVLQNGVGDDVYGLAMDGDSLYVGGLFTGIGPHLPAARIARFDTRTNQWYALGSGLNDEVYAVAVIAHNVYVGGLFTTAGGVSANHIARWNGTSWSALGAGMDGRVFALAARGSNLYVGGWFQGSIGKWNGTSWSTMGSGTDGMVRAIALPAATGDVYVGGWFLNAGEKSSLSVGLYHDTP